MHESSQARRGAGLRTAVCLTGVLILAACASTPLAPIASIQAARSAIGDAEKAGAGRYAAPELGEAREKLAAANSAVEQKHMNQAERLAEQSRVEADLANAKSAEAKATAVNDEMMKSNQALGEELQRKSGAQP
jgi:hypothetical protein